MPDLTLANVEQAFDPFDLVESLQITSIKARPANVGGTWIKGTIAGYRFEALAFADDAHDPSYELGTSRLSKLWLQRLADRQQVYHWDRGEEVASTDPQVIALVTFLATGLADLAELG